VSSDSADERVKVWVDNQLIIDMWTSLGSAQPQGTISLRAESLHLLELEYAQYSGDASLSLEWAYGAAALGAIPTGRLYYESHLLDRTAAPIPVSPGPICAALSTAYGAGLSLATAATPAFFTVRAKDAAGNEQQEPGVDAVIRVQSTADRNLRSHSVDGLSAGLFIANYTAVSAAAARNVLVSFAAAGGLQATYYDSAALASPVSSRVDSTVDFSAAASDKPAVSLTDGDDWGARWAGFVRPSFAQVYTFFAEVVGAGERIKLWVDNSLIVDQWTSLEGLESSGTISVASENGYYDITVEYKNTDGTLSAAGASIRWESTAYFWPSLPKGVISSRNLYQDLPIGASPFSVSTVSCGVCTCGTTSTASGDTLSLMTAGTVPAFTITARDAAGTVQEGHVGFGALLSGPTVAVSTLDGEAAANMPVLCTSGECSPSYSAAAVTLSGWYLLAIEAARAGGLWATYYSSIHAGVVGSAEPVSAAIQDQPEPLTALSGGWSARWAGFVRPEYSEEYTFYATASCSEYPLFKMDGFRVYLNGLLAIDQWESCSGFASTAVALIAESLHALRVEFRNAAGAAEFALRWSSNSTSIGAIPASSLYYGSGHIAGSPFRVSVLPEIANATRTDLQKPTSSARTAGEAATFIVVARDLYGNVADDSSALTINFVRDGARNLRATTLRDGKYVTAAYTQTSAGSAQLVGTVASLGGGEIAATYYDGQDLTVPSSARVDAAVDFSAAANDVLPASSLTPDAGFSVRWTGLVRPEYAQEYTWFAALQTAGERVKLWVDNELLVDQWTSLEALEGSGTLAPTVADGYYDLMVEYKHLVGNSTAAGVQLKWEGNAVSKDVLPTTRIYYRHEAFTHDVMQIAGAACGSTSTVSGSVLSLATAGIAATFTVTARDEFGNARGCYGDLVGAWGAVLAPASASTSSCLGGVHVLTYLPAAAAGTHTLNVMAGENAVAGSPFSVTVVPGDANVSTSVLSGEEMSLATAGVAASFSITAKDLYGSLHTAAPTRWVMSIDGSSVFGSVSIGSSGTHIASYTVTSSGHYSVRLQLAENTGLLLSVHPSEDLSSHVFTERSTNVDFYGTPSSAISGTYFLARWNGVVWPDYAQTYDFTAVLSDVSDRVKLWIENSLIIDQWSSLTSLTPTAGVTFASAGGRDFAVQYRHHSGYAGLQVLWESAGTTVVPRQPIPADSLSCFPDASAASATLPLVIVPATATGSSIAGHAVSLGTAGAAAAFTISARDTFGNLPAAETDFAVHLNSDDRSSRSVHGLLYRSSGADAAFPGTIAAPMTAGSYTFEAYQAVPGGLFATYYAAADLTNPVSARNEDSIDFSAGVGTLPAATLTASAAYSVRWTGLVRPPYSQVKKFEH
jgi:hypothetical protein